MQVIYHDTKDAIAKTAVIAEKKLTIYRDHIDAVIAECDDTYPEYSLATFQDEDLLETIERLQQKYRRAQHVIVVGIGGSSLGIEAIDAVLAPANPNKQLHVLDAVSPYRIDQLMATLKSARRVRDVVVCIISKSGSTTETLANAAVLLGVLQKKYGRKLHQQVIYIGNESNPLLSAGEAMQSEIVSMPEVVGGRYSVFTSVGMIPLALLGHDVGEIMCGVEDAAQESFDDMTIENAARLFAYAKAGYHTLNFFGFDVRLEKLGFWTRQLVAESIGKETMKNGKPNKLSLIPTITTPVELHSIGQLYFSGFPGIYTEFVGFSDELYDQIVPTDTTLAPKLAGKSLTDIGAAIYGGVIGAYQEQDLPYRSTEFDDSLPYSLGLYMSMRMRETMYLAELMDVNAFDQPNVELYKKKTKKLLGI